MKLFNNSKMSNNWTKLIKSGKNRTSIWLNIRKEIKIVDGCWQIFKKRSCCLMINYLICRLLLRVNMLEHSLQGLEIGKDHSTWFLNVSKYGCKCRRSGNIWKEFSLETKILNSSWKNKARNLRKIMLPSRK